MVEEFHTSFIPKKPVVETETIRRSSVGWLMAIAIIIVVAVLAGALGVFLYVKGLEASINRKEQELVKAQELFEPSLIQELKRLDARIRTSAEILDDHVALSRFFDVLEGLTLKSVRFGSFSYTASPVGSVVSMTGEAGSFGTIALQSDVFADSPVIQNPIFTNLAVDQDGNVSFDFEALISTEVLLYVPRVNKTVGEEGEVGPGPLAPDNANGGDGGDGSGGGTGTTSPSGESGNN